MTKRPSIPMRPEDVPQQRLYPVSTLPSRPPEFQGYCDYINPLAKEVRPKGSPRKTHFLCTVEWAWSPAHNRVDSYYLNPRGRYWLLWNYFQDFNDEDLKWKWVLYGYGLRRDVEEKQAAVYLLLDAWKSEARRWDLDRYHWIDGEGFLSIGDITAIAQVVWPEEVEDGRKPDNALPIRTTGKVIRKGKNFSMMEASKDDPIYKRGFVIGGRSSRRSSRGTQATPSGRSKKTKPRS